MSIQQPFPMKNAIQKTFSIKKGNLAKFPFKIFQKNSDISQ